MVDGIIATLAGLLLIAPARDKISPGSTCISAVTLISAVIGVVAVLLGVLIMGGMGITLIVGGIALSGSALSRVPAIGAYLERAGAALRPSRIVIGAIMLILGVLSILEALDG
jgi:hypothetical protein